MQSLQRPHHSPEFYAAKGTKHHARYQPWKSGFCRGTGCPRMPATPSATFLNRSPKANISFQ